MSDLISTNEEISRKNILSGKFEALETILSGAINSNSLGITKFMLHKFEI